MSRMDATGQTQRIAETNGWHRTSPRGVTTPCPPTAMPWWLAVALCGAVALGLGLLVAMVVVVVFGAGAEAVR